MPALKPTSFKAEITWLGHVPTDARLASVPQTQMPLTFAGPDREKHAGLTRPSCSRVTSQHPKGTEIRNVRQISILSAQELQMIALEIGLTDLDPQLLGATIVIDGIPDFTHVPPSSRLQGPDGTTLVVDMENRACHLPAREIEEAHGPEHSRKFKAAARYRRGVTAWVEREGTLRVGEELRLHVPDQPSWVHLSDALS